jgi:nucleoside transporter
MMFLQYAIWGSWYVTVGNYMDEIGMTAVIHWAYTVGPIASIASPFFLGMIADRFFPSEKVISGLHLAGGIALLLAPVVAEGESQSSALFIMLLLVNQLCYMPTVAVTNSLAFTHMTDQEKQFPLIRVFGTIGWIAAGIFVSGLLEADETSIPLRVAGITSIIMAFFSLTLPHTPPPAKGEKSSVREILGIDALKSLNSKPFIIFIISSFLICIPLAVYYAYAPVFVNGSGIENPAFKMSFGQMSEVVFILIMPLLFPKIGIKNMLLIGMGAWVLRYILFALGAPDSVFWMIMFGIILHGICYDFFFVAGFIYVDKKASPEIRGQAQGIVVLATYGVGMLIGSQIGGFLFNNIIISEGTEALNQWQNFWIIPAVLAAAVMIFFWIFFNDRVIVKTRSANEEK